MENPTHFAHPLTSSRRVFILVDALLGDPSVSSEGHQRGLSRESQVRVQSQKYILWFCVEIKSKIRKKMESGEPPGRLLHVRNDD